MDLNIICNEVHYVNKTSVIFSIPGRIYITWLFLETFCYSYNAWAIALRATFPYQTPNNVALWFTADYICDVFYLLDVVLIKPRLIFLHEGFWVTDQVETRKHYRKNTQYKVSLTLLTPVIYRSCYAYNILKLLYTFFYILTLTRYVF